MPSPVIAIYDANILYPAPLRDLFVRLGHVGLVRARWTEAINDEWTRSVLHNHPHLSAERIARTRALMNNAVRDCLVSGYEHLIGSLSLPDAEDRHVLAAAIHARAAVIVTSNVKDFPSEVLDAFEIEAVHPDLFLIPLIESSPLSVCTVIQRQRESLRNPAKSIDEFLATLEAQGFPSAVAWLRDHQELL